MLPKLKLNTMNMLQILQKPTTEIISTYYPMDSKVQETFLNILSIYFTTSTDNMVKSIKNILAYKNQSAKTRMSIIKALAEDSSSEAIAKAQKHFEDKLPIPEGLPTPESLIVGLGAMPRNDNYLLMDIQAAARILAIADDPMQIFSKGTDNRYKKVLNPDVFLDKETATKPQRVEDLCKLHVASADYYRKKYDIILEAYKAYALETLYDAAGKISNKELSLLITDLVLEYGEYKPVNTDSICDSALRYSKNAFNPMNVLMSKRLTQIFHLCR